MVPSQYGFRNNRSTIHAILDLVTFCFDNINSKIFSTWLSLDIKKAFDFVSYKTLLQKLHHYGIRDVANLLHKSYSTDQKQYVSNAAKRSSERIIEYGIPQGSILGPLLFWFISMIFHLV